MAESTTAGKVKVHRVPVTEKDGNTSAMVTGKSSPFFQPKLTVGPTDDVYEKEADAVAEKVMRTPAPAEQPFFAPPAAVANVLQRKCAACKDEENLQRKEDKQEAEDVIVRKTFAGSIEPVPDEDQLQRKQTAFLQRQKTSVPATIASPIQHTSGLPENPYLQRKCKAYEQEEKANVQRKVDPQPAVSSEAPAMVHDVLKTVGNPLGTETREFMESRFGYDFSSVKIHTNSTAATSAQAINALAYTSGNNIVFNEGQYAPASATGKKLLAHELTHVLQQTGSILVRESIQRQTPLSQAELNNLCYDINVPQPNPSARNPELHPTYASWVGSFTGMSTFATNDTVPGHTARNSFSALGTAGRRFNDSTATSETESVPFVGRARSGEEFIDHPTNQWVVNCLPANLRATAYQLPADCADIAVILRHVWLSAHHRTETYNNWVVGDSAGQANQARARRLITAIYSGNVRAMVNPYSDSQGNTLTDFTTLQNLLHVGDVLVWEHREVIRSGTAIRSVRSGGHTQTINQITRSGGTITNIHVLQGNQPIFSDAATSILTDRNARDVRPDSPAGRALRDLPGRRIEASSAISLTNIEQPVTGNAIWGAIDTRNAANQVTEFTVLIAAGPPRAASRPSARSTGRRITDWTATIQHSSRASLPGVLEAALQEARSMIEQGAATANPVTTADMNSLGQRYGSRIHTLFNRMVADLLQRVPEVVTVIRALRDDSINRAVAAPYFNAFEAAFVQSALPQATVEERRLFTEFSSLNNFLLPFASQIADFTTALRATRNMVQARAIAEQHGNLLWQAASNRSSAGLNNDDRPLYWSRLHMIEILRQGITSFRITAADRQQLIQLFESASRGISTTQGSSLFPSTNLDKRIMISGFDPFDLPTDVRDSNPSGAVVLALDGQTITHNNISAQVEGVVFPVRFRDFDQGMIETLMLPYLNGTHPLNMIMTISQGRINFDIEQWAGRRRSASLPDNEGVSSGGHVSNPVEPPGLSAGQEFLETRLPHTAMSQVPQAVLNSTGRSELGGTAITGTGGGFLSNEIFYRTRLLQETIGGDALNIRVGHLHVPAFMGRQSIIARVQEILRASLPVI